MVDSYKKIISEIKNEGLYKVERPITSSQDVDISTEKNPSVLNFCANNYLGLANNSEIIATAKKALDDYGFGIEKGFYKGDKERQSPSKIKKF